MSMPPVSVDACSVLVCVASLLIVCGQANGEVSSQHIVAKDNFGGGAGCLIQSDTIAVNASNETFDKLTVRSD